MRIAPLARLNCLATRVSEVKPSRAEMGERSNEKKVQKVHLDESEQSADGGILAVSKALPAGAAQ